MTLGWPRWANWRVAAIAAAFCLTLAYAPPAQADARRQTAAIMKDAGLAHSFGQLQGALQNAFVANFRNVSRDVQEKAAKAMDETFSQAALLATARAAFEQAHHPTHATAVTTFHNSPLGKRLTAARAALRTPEGEKDFHAFIRTAKENQPFVERHRMVAEFLEEYPLVENTLGIQAALMVSVLLGAEVYKNGAVTLTDVEIRQLQSSLIGQNLQEVGNFMAAQIAYSYRDLSTDEIREVFAFQRGPAGRWLFETTINASLEAIGVAGETFQAQMLGLRDPNRMELALPPAR